MDTNQPMSQFIHYYPKLFLSILLNFYLTSFLILKRSSLTYVPVFLQARPATLSHGSPTGLYNID